MPFGKRSENKRKDWEYYKGIVEAMPVERLEREVDRWQNGGRFTKYVLKAMHPFDDYALMMNVGEEIVHRVRQNSTYKGGIEEEV